MKELQTTSGVAAGSEIDVMENDGRAVLHGRMDL